MSDWNEAIKEMRKILLGMNSPGMDAEWRGACRTALSELEKLKRPAPLDGGWMPIKDIPDKYRDGRKFLALTADYMHGHRFNENIQVGRWSGSHYASRDGQIITHWQPLPAAPASTEKAEEGSRP